MSKIGFAVTLLHTHKHAPTNSVLTYQKGWRTAKYFPIEIANRDYFPCAWYLNEDDVPIAYEFS